MNPELSWQWDRPEDWPGTGVRLAVLGFPVKHSVSPAMHNRALAELAAGEPAFWEWRYGRLEVPAERLAETLPRLHAAGFRGLNLTLPHKVRALDLVAGVDPAARARGAINTLLWTPEGWHGANTDGFGLVAALREELGVNWAGRPVVIVGAGGAARAAVVQALEDGAGPVWVLNRTPTRLAELVAAVAAVPGAAALRTGDLETVPAGLPEGAIVVNATAAGMEPGQGAPVDLAAWPRPAAVYDMIYNPPVPPLVAAARALGVPAASGLGMLVWQGVRALELWTGRPVSAAAMRTAAAAALGLAAGS